MWLVWLAVLWIVLSGVDDLFIGLVFLFGRGKPFRWPDNGDLKRVPQLRTAIFVPLWQEHQVIRQMLDRNLTLIDYRDYEVFVGVYPNDAPTLEAVAQAAGAHPRVHIAVCQHDGPTSKGDCLNAIYRHMQRFEAEHGLRFEVIITHDAEDLIHPESLLLINWFLRDHEMVQIPVLPLATGWSAFTHGVYCDEFADFQMKDIPVRARLGGFLPANGVGTGFARDALDRLAAHRGKPVFDPDCLTEDYEIGCCLHSLGCRQLFVPLRLNAGSLVATREYFPRGWNAAVRQRSRWVAGIALQGWEHHGWRGPLLQIYWFWRDRKGLIGNLVSPAANAGWILGLAGIVELRAMPHSLLAATLAIAVAQTGLRMYCCGLVYSWRFALGVPLRMFWCNWINMAATHRAIRQYIAARLRRRRLAWVKTDHAYPAALALPETGAPPV